MGVHCGLKLTHDGSIAVIDGQRLALAIEAEKISNRARHAELTSFDEVFSIIESAGYAVRDLPNLVIDGWGWERGDPRLAVSFRGKSHKIEVAGYHEQSLSDNLMNLTIRREVDGLKYVSTTHVCGHILSSYCTSPFAILRRSAYVAVWDGGMLPRIYYVNPGSYVQPITALGPILPYVGNLFAVFASHMSYFRKSGSDQPEWYEMEVAGKAMALAAYGTVDRTLFETFDAVADDCGAPSVRWAFEFASQYMRKYPDAADDIGVLATLQEYLGDLLVSAIEKAIVRYHKTGRGNVVGDGEDGICLAGGCALNIKWNRKVRDKFPEVWVPPFPNDSGSAIGAACWDLIRREGEFALQWDVFSGPKLELGELPEGWDALPCTVEALGELLAASSDAVVFLSGRAELGPRALGARSIIAPATHVAYRNLLNQVKDRESYRPVAPMCLADQSSDIFDPGRDDRFMLFDHNVRPSWRDRIPAIVHADGTARLQTIDESSNPEMYALLSAYAKITGVPVLCNTSANFKGSGFFPDVASAMQWGKIPRIWSGGRLFRRRSRD